MAKPNATQSWWPTASPVFALAVVIAIAYCLYLFPLEFIAGRGPYWDNLRADAETHVIGMRYFLADRWRFPITQTRLLMAPGGVNIVFTDSIPLMALVAKTLGFMGPARLNYFGLWYVIAYVLQGVTAVYFVRALGVRAVAPQVAAAVMAMSFPALLFRTTLHASLTGHFFILWTLGLYFTGVRQGGFRRTWIWFACALWMALLVHPYLFLMVFSIFAAAAAQHMATSRRAILEALAVGGLVLSSLGLLMWLVGYLGSSGGAGGFGHYSMNLLSPWVPQRSGLFPRMQGVIDATGGQHEGFNYLGAGSLLLLAVAAWTVRASFPAIARKYWALSLVLLCLFGLAVSNRVFAGTWRVSHIGPGIATEIGIPARDPAGETATARSESAAARSAGKTSGAIVRLALVTKMALAVVRSSGRFFWPIGYVLLIGSLAVVATRLRPTTGLVLTLAAVVLQLLDTAPLRQEIRDKFSGHVSFAAMPATLQFPPDVRWQNATVTAIPWQRLIGAHRHLTILPGFPCAGFRKRWDVLDLLFQASATATPANTAYLSRPSGPTDCAGDERTTLSHGIGQGELLVVLTPPVSKWRVALLPGFSHSCRSFVLGFVCSQLWNQSSGDVGDAMFVPVPAMGKNASYVPGTVIDFSVGGNSQQYQTFGWSTPHANGSLVEETGSGLELGLGENDERDLTLTARVRVAASVTSPAVFMAVRVNGALAETWKLPTGASTEVLAVIRRQDVGPSGRIRIAFEVPATANSPRRETIVGTGPETVEMEWARIDRKD